MNNQKLIYSARIEYSPENLRRLNNIINNTFRLRIKLIYLGMCISLFIAGAAVGLNNSTGIMLICAGCFLLPSIRTVDNSRVNEAIRKLNGNIVKVNYAFHDDVFICSNDKERNTFSYSSIIRLVEEREYLYMFPNKYQAYMIKLSSIEPSNENEFKAFISSKTNLEWTQRISLLTLNLKKLKFNRRNTKKVL